MENEPEFTPQQKKALMWQIIAFIAAFAFFLPTGILSLSLFNGSLSCLSLLLPIPFLYIGISSIKNKVSIVWFRRRMMRGGKAVIVGVILVVVMSASYLTALAQLFGAPDKDDWVNLPTYNALPIRQPETGTRTYYPVEQPSVFVHLNTFMNISSWSSHQEVPLVIHGNSLIIAGSVGGDEGVNLPLLNADINTGKVKWQTVVGSVNIAADRERIYTEAPNRSSGGATSIIAYDLDSGMKIWETTFDWRYANHVSNLTVNREHVIVQTVNQGKLGFYHLHPETGEIQRFSDYDSFFTVENGTYYEWADDSIKASGILNWELQLPNSGFWYERDLAAPVIHEQLILVKNGHRALSPIVAVRKTDGMIIWRFDESVVSNIAVQPRSF
jgi:hypothetical protein